MYIFIRAIVKRVSILCVAQRCASEIMMSTRCSRCWYHVKRGTNNKSRWTETCICEKYLLRAKCRNCLPDFYFFRNLFTCIHCCCTRQTNYYYKLELKSGDERPNAKHTPHTSIHLRIHLLCSQSEIEKKKSRRSLSAKILSRMQQKQQQ